MNENNNLNVNMGVNPGQPVQPNMGVNPGQQMQPNMGVNPGQPVQPNMGVNPGQPVQPNMGVSMNPKKSNNKTIILIASVVIAIVATVIVVILFLTGGTKTLTCTQEKDMSGMKMTGVVKFDFKGNTVEKMNMKITFDLGEYVSMKDTFISAFEEEYESMEESGIPVKITSDDTKVYVELSANKDTFKEAGVSTSDSYDEVKSDLEEQGFVCK